MYVQHDNYSYHCCMVYLKVAKRVDPKSSRHEKNIIFVLFFFVSINI